LALQEGTVWAAPVTTFEVNPVVLVLFLTLWSGVMGMYLHFWWRVAPAALRRWADAEGYQIVERRRAGLLDWFSFAAGSGHHVFQVVVRDREGREHQGLVRVGTPYWFCTSASRCPVEVRWGQVKDTLETVRELADLGRYGWGGPAPSTARRVVLGFAAADLMLASLVLLFELAMLVAAVIGIDRLSGNLPSPGSTPEDLLAAAMIVGMFALYLPALITLSAGGVGLIRRKPWGYYYHIAGAVLVAVSCFGIVYTVPALLVAIQPWFKGYCLGKQAPDGKADLIGDL
jgi:hypothetical protein